MGRVLASAVWSMNGFPFPHHQQATPTYTPAGAAAANGSSPLQQPPCYKKPHRAPQHQTDAEKENADSGVSADQTAHSPKMTTSLPLVLLLVALPQAAAAPPPSAQGKRASWDDVNVIAHGLLQLGQGLKEHVDKTKAQMRQVDGKLKAFNGSVAQLERRQREQGESLAARLKELEDRERSLEELAQDVRARVEEAKGRSDGLLVRMETVEGNNSDEGGVPLLQVRRKTPVLAMLDCERQR